MDDILTLSSRYPTHRDFTIGYGPDGVRADASLLSSTAFRCGILVAARSIQKKKAVGVMLSASSGPPEQNGIRLVDPSGDTIDTPWELCANALCLAKTNEVFCEVLREIIPTIPKHVCANKVVLVGRDTRESGKALVEALKDGVSGLGVKIIDIGTVTTPQLHFYVRCCNQYSHIDKQVLIPSLYYTTFENSFEILFKPDAPKRLYVDCANGVGHSVMAKLAPKLGSLGLWVSLRNTGDGSLNDRCGASYVFSEKVFPDNFDDFPEWGYGCSMNGDADRLVYFTRRGGEFVLLDGDRLAVLFGIYLKYLILNIEDFPEYTVGIVRTTDANGGATDFIRKGMRMETVISRPGIKRIHETAMTYDIGIYFEANGHGTVLFDPEFIKKIEALDDDNIHVLKFLAIANLMNQDVGDAVATMLFAEAVFTTGFSLRDWIELYEDETHDDHW